MEPPADLVELKEEVEERPKKKRLLSDNQRDALKLGREKSWKKLIQSVPSEEPIKRMEQTYSSNSSEDYDSFSDSSTDEESRQRRKQIALKKSIPKPIRRRLDRYIKKKLEESKLSGASRSQVEDLSKYYPMPPAAPPAPHPYQPPTMSVSSNYVPPAKPGPVFL